MRPRSRAPIWRPRRCCCEAMGIGGLRSRWTGWMRRRRPRSSTPPNLLRQLGADGRAGARRWRAIRCIRGLARLIVEARRRGVAEDGCTVAALLSAGERLPARPRARHALRPAGAAGIANGSRAPRRLVRQVRRIGQPAAAARRRDEDALLISHPGRLSRPRGAAPAGRGAAAGRAAAPAQLAPNSTVTGADSWWPSRPKTAATRRRRWCAWPAPSSRSGCSTCFRTACARSRALEWNRAAERVESVQRADVRPDRDRREPRHARPRSRRRAAGATKPWKPAWRASRIPRKSRPSSRAVRISPRSTVPCRGRARSKPRCDRLPRASRASPNWKPRRAAAACCAPWSSRCRRPTRRLLEEIAPERIRLPRRPAGARCTTKPASRPGSPPACRISSACARRPQWRAAPSRWWCACWRPTSGPCR